MGVKSLTLGIESIEWPGPPIAAASRALGITTADIKRMTQIEDRFAWRVHTYNHRRLVVGALDLIWHSL